jgi:hypothetical protein
MTSKVRVPSVGFAFSGWKGTLDVDGDVLHVVGEDASKRLDIDTSQVKRYSLNGNNGLWSFRMKDGAKLYLRVLGLIPPTDGSPKARNPNAEIRELLRKNGAKSFPW